MRIVGRLLSLVFWSLVGLAQVLLAVVHFLVRRNSLLLKVRQLYLVQLSLLGIFLCESNLQPSDRLRVTDTLYR